MRVIWLFTAFGKALLPVPKQALSNGADVLLFCLATVAGFADFQRLKADKEMIRM